jgi:hypothetical protein
MLSDLEVAASSPPAVLARSSTSDHSSEEVLGRRVGGCLAPIGAEPQGTARSSAPEAHPRLAGGHVRKDRFGRRGWRRGRKGVPALWSRKLWFVGYSDTRGFLRELSNTGLEKHG